jgi:hypothetical protein
MEGSMSSRVLDALRPPKQATELETGHVVVVTHDDAIEVRSADGGVQVRITLGDGAPVVSLTGARLELDSPDIVRVNARAFEVRTTEKVDIRTEGTMELSSGKSMNVFADEDFTARAPCIWLN